MDDYVYVALVLGSSLKTVNVLKGKRWTAATGGEAFELAGAFRLAKPGSWWDRNCSSAQQRERSAERDAPHGDAKRAPL
jgi:hypothetical protein